MKKRKSKSYIDLEPRIPLLSNYSREKLQNDLKSAWEVRDIARFSDILTDYPCDIEAIYKDLSNLRIVDVLANVPGNDAYLKELITKDKSAINNLNIVTRKATIHYAAEVGNASAIEILLNGEANANVQDSNGDTALHILIKKYEPGQQHFRDCLQNLLSWPHIVLNIPNFEKYTPIHLAAKMGDQSIIEMFLKFSELLDLDSFRSFEDNTTARDILIKTFPDLEPDLPGIWIPNPYKVTDYQYRLFYYLVTGQELRFCSIIREAMNNECKQFLSLLTCVDAERLTYLHRACEKGFKKALKTLIRLGANANYTLDATDSSIVVAAKNGHHEILSILLTIEDIDLSPNEHGETLLHVIVHPRNTTTNSAECLRKVLCCPEIDVNGRDCKGRTALHIAARNSDEPSIFTLLDHGAQLNITDNFIETPLNLLSMETLKKYLDSKIVSDNLPTKNCDFAISLHVPFVSNQTDHIYSVSTDLLCSIAQSHELKQLLAHPIYSCVIFLKWKRVRVLFYFTLFFYAIFCFLTTTYLFFLRDANSITEECTLLQNSNETNSIIRPCNANANYQFAAQCFIIIGILILTLIEAIQVISGPKRYARILENWLQCAVIIFSTATIASNCGSTPEPGYLCPQLSAVTIFLIWLEFFFVTGNHPKLNFFIDIFRKASMFLFHFLAVHTSLIIGFSLSFHMLFRDEDGPFKTAPTALFKTLIMITGEFDVGEIPLNTYPVVSHLIFGSFIFLVAIVLFNLLIGLAVSATKPIEENAFLHRCISQVPIISSFEDIYFSNTHMLKKLLLMLCNCGRSPMYPQNDTITTILQVFPNQNNRMQLHFIPKNSDSDEGGKNILHLHHRLSKKIMDDLQIIIANKQDTKVTNCDKIYDLSLKLERIHANLDEELRIMKTALFEIMEHLKDDGDGDGLATGQKKKKNKLDALKKRLKAPVIKLDQLY